MDTKENYIQLRKGEEFYYSGIRFKLLEPAMCKHMTGRKLELLDRVDNQLMDVLDNPLLRSLELENKYGRGIGNYFNPGAIIHIPEERIYGEHIDITQLALNF